LQFTVTINKKRVIKMAKITLDELKAAFDKKPEDIIEYFKSLGVVLSDDWDDYFEKFGKDAFKIAGINNANHLMDAKELIEEAISKGTDLKVFKDSLKFGLDLRGWHADLVVTQNISNAYNAGRYYQQIDDTEGFPYVRPVTLNDRKTTKICDWLGKQNYAFRIDDPNLNKMYSPRHFHCRTYYVSITEKQKERMGYIVKDIDEIPEQYLNHKEFRKLPSEKYNPDLSKFPKELKEKIA